MALRFLIKKNAWLHQIVLSFHQSDQNLKRNTTSNCFIFEQHFSKIMILIDRQCL